MPESRGEPSLPNPLSQTKPNESRFKPPFHSPPLTESDRSEIALHLRLQQAKPSFKMSLLILVKFDGVVAGQPAVLAVELQ